MYRLLQLCIVLSLMGLFAGCVSAPFNYPKEKSVAIMDIPGTPESLRVQEWVGGREDVDGFYPLIEGFDAFGARLKLMTHARTSIDAQYFLMKPDHAGLVFASEMMKAADRGVRVR